MFEIVQGVVGYEYICVLVLKGVFFKLRNEAAASVRYFYLFCKVLDRQTPEFGLCRNTQYIRRSNSTVGWDVESVPLVSYHCSGLKPIFLRVHLLTSL